MIKFIFYLLFKKKKKSPIPKEMEELLLINNYNPLEEWKTNNKHKEE